MPGQAGAVAPLTERRWLMSDAPDDNLDKQDLRAAALARRGALTDGARVQAAVALAGRALPVAIEPGLVVAGYWPIRSEIDPFPLMASFAERGATLALPVIPAANEPLQFRGWTPGAALEEGLFGIPHPSAAAPLLRPDIVLTPLAAFDRRGHRIGYGAGYYDRSLLELRAEKAVIAIGLAFSVQEVAVVPFEAHDVALDFVLTETETFDCRSS